MLNLKTPPNGTITQWLRTDFELSKLKPAWIIQGVSLIGGGYYCIAAECHLTFLRGELHIV